MSGRRTILLGLAVALILAAVGWFVFREPLAPPPPLELGAERGAGIEEVRIPVADDADAKTSAKSADGPARDAAPSAGAGLEGGAIDEFTADGVLEDDPEARPRTSALGRVIDESDKPVAGATVLASTKETLAGAALDALANKAFVRRAESGADGTFRLANLDPGPLRLEVHAKEAAPLVAREIHLPPGEKSELGDFRLARGVVLAGRVVDSDRRPVRASIFLVSTPVLGPVHKLGVAAASPLGESAEDGQFELACLAPGKWTLLVRSTDFPETAFDVEAPANVSRVADLELALTVGAEIGGHILDYDESTMKGLSVIALPEDGPESFSASKPPGANLYWLAGVQETPVDRIGRFTIKALAPARNYVLRAGQELRPGEGTDPDRTDPWAPFSVVPAGEPDVELTYLPGCRIEFDVVDDTNGAPIERLRVQVEGMSPSENSASTDKDSPPASFFPGGHVSLVDLRAKVLESPIDPTDPPPQTGLASLSVEAPGYDTAHLKGLRLEPGARRGLGTVALRPMALLEVRVSDAQSGSPIAGARVEIRADHPERLTGRTRSVTLSDGRGFARLTSLGTSEATLFAACPGYAPLQTAISGIVRLAAPPMEIALARQARVSVRVRDSHGDPAGSVTVGMERQASPDRMVWRRSLVTDAAGLAVFSDMPDGVFLVAAVSRAGIPTQTPTGSALPSQTTLTVQGGDDLTVNLDIQAFSSLSGTIWFGREPLSRAQISLEPGARGFRDLGTNMTVFSTAPRFFTDGTGSFDRLELMPGVYSLLIDQREFDVHTLRVVRVEPSPTAVIIDIADTAITGTVFDTHGNPAVNATVQLFADRPGQRRDIRPLVGEFLVPFEDYRRPVAETTTNALGVYRLACVPPGIPLEMFFTSGRRAKSILKINAPQGRTLEGIDAILPDTGSLEVVLAAPLAPHGLHYGVRVVGVEQPEGLAMIGAVFGENNRAHFDDLPPGRWVVMVFSLNKGEQVVDRRQPQLVQVKPDQQTEFSVGW